MTLMVGTMTKAEVEQREAARRAADKERRSRVEILGLPWCDICGGAKLGVTDDASLACVCDQRAAELGERLQAIIARCSKPTEPHWSDRDTA